MFLPRLGPHRATLREPRPCNQRPLRVAQTQKFAEWGELVQFHDDRHVFQAPPDELSAIDIHSV